MIYDIDVLTNSFQFYQLKKIVLGSEVIREDDQFLVIHVSCKCSDKIISISSSQGDSA